MLMFCMMLGCGAGAEFTLLTTTFPVEAAGTATTLLLP